jgi:5-methylthioribose kinase
MNDLELPIHGRADETEEPSCSPRVYVSNEEAAVVRAMHDVKARADVLRRRLLDAGSASDQGQHLEAELSTLRTQWSELCRRREQAYRRKMVMLGHLPPEALVE